MLLAEQHLARARVAFAEGDATAAVLWASTCAEVALDTIARANAIDTRKDHFRRASIARRLHEAGVLRDDLANLLIRLNTERKHAIYDSASPDLRGRSWEEVLAALDELVAAAAAARA